MSGNGIGIRNPLGGWTLRELVKELDVRTEFNPDRLKLDEGGVATVRNEQGEVRFHGKVHTLEQLQAFVTALGLSTGGALPTSAQPFDGETVDWNRLVRGLETRRLEQSADDRLWQGRKIVDGIEPRYSRGRPFSLPFVHLPEGRGALLKTSRTLPEIELALHVFQSDDGGVFSPIHPQEMEPRGFTNASTQIPGVRNTSSERTIHSGHPALRDVFLKLDLAHVKHSQVTRPIHVAWAREVVAKTQWLMDWIDQYSTHDVPDGELDPFAFLPEGAAILDHQADAAVVIRSAKPYPPLKTDHTAWILPVYSLWSKDEEFPSEPPLLVRLIRDRPDKTVSELDYFEQKILRPLIASEMRAVLDLGAELQAHGQNTYLELGSDGEPSGRIVHADLEDFWPHPDAALLQARESLYDASSVRPSDKGDTINPGTTFQTYFVEGLLLPLDRRFGEYFPEFKNEGVRRRLLIFRDEFLRRPHVMEFRQSMAFREMALFADGVERWLQ